MDPCIYKLINTFSTADEGISKVGEAIKIKTKKKKFAQPSRHWSHDLTCVVCTTHQLSERVTANLIDIPWRRKAGTEGTGRHLATGGWQDMIPGLDSHWTSFPSVEDKEVKDSACALRIQTSRNCRTMTRKALYWVLVIRT